MELYLAEGATSVKYWAIEVRGTTVHMQSGRAGAKGRSSHRRFDSKAAAAMHAETRVREKTRTGFVPARRRHQAGERFPGCRPPQSERMDPTSALAYMVMVIKGEKPADLDALMRCFALAGEPRLQCLDHIWCFELGELDGFDVRLSRQYRPLGAPDRWDAYMRLGCRAKLAPSGRSGWYEVESEDGSLSEFMKMTAESRWFRKNGGRAVVATELFLKPVTQRAGPVATRPDSASAMLYAAAQDDALADARP